MVVEKAVAESHKDKIKASYTDTKYVNNGPYTELSKKCHSIAQLKGIEALRMSYLFDGEEDSFEKLEIPPIEIFVENHYKKYDIGDISIKKLDNITKINVFKEKQI